MEQTSSMTRLKMEEQIDVWIDQYGIAPIDYNGIIDGITSAANWIGFLMVFKGNVVSLVHSMQQFRTGLGVASPGNSQIFGLVRDSSYHNGAINRWTCSVGPERQSA
jgi:hypothetical protein